jgi:hypothetical protein
VCIKTLCPEGAVERFDEGVVGRLAWTREVDLSVGWFEAIAAGELEHTSNSVVRFTGKAPMNLDQYFTLFPELLQPLRSTEDQDSVNHR